MICQEIEEGLEAPYREPFREDSGEEENYFDFISPGAMHDGLSGTCIEMLAKDSQPANFRYSMTKMYDKRKKWVKHKKKSHK